MLDRKSAPAFAEVRNLTLPTHNTSILENGLPITLLNGVAQEVVKIDVVFTASKWNEPSVGVAHFTSAMLAPQKILYTYYLCLLICLLNQNFRKVNCLF